MSLLGSFEKGSTGGLIGLLQKINRAASPSGEAVSDPELEALAGPQGTAAAQEQYRRQYASQRARAIQNGANFSNMDALAAPGAQDAYTDSLTRSAKALEMIRGNREKTDRLAAVRRMVEGITDPTARETARANPEAYSEAAIKKQFAPANENFSMTAIGDGTIAVLDRRDGAHTIVRDPAAVAAIKKNVASVQQGADGLYVIGNDGTLINTIPFTPKASGNQDLQERKLSMAMRKEFDALPEVKNYRATLPIIQSIKKAPDTAAGDMDLAYAAGKVFDPDSVVREGELAMTLKTGSVMQQILGTTRFQLSGKGRMPAEQRAAIIGALQNRVDSLRQPYLQAKSTYEGYAADNEFKSEHVVGKDSLDAFATPAAPGGAGSTLKYTRNPTTGRLERAQ